MTPGQHRHGAAIDAGAMRRLIDAARQSRGNDEPGFAEIARQLAREFAVLWRKRHKPARPDIVRTDQPQPVDTLLVGQVCCSWRSSVHAAPRGSMDQPEGVGKGVAFVIRDAPIGASQESILPIVVMVPGSVASLPPRNDGGRLPDPDPVHKGCPVLAREQRQ